VAEYDKVIPPGQTGKITATLDTKKYRGKLDKSIVVVSNDPDNEKVTIHLHCSVLGVKILPANRAYFNAHFGESQTKELTVATIGEGPITAYAIASKPNIIVKLLKLNEPKPTSPNEYWKQYKLLITIPDNFPEGRFAESVTLATNSSYTDPIKIPIAGSVTPSVIVSPMVIRMYYNGHGKLPHRSIRITKKAGNNFTVSRVLTNPPKLKAVLEETKKGKQFIVHLSWTDIQTKGQFNGSVVIHTNDKIKPVITVPVHVSIK